MIKKTSIFIISVLLFCTFINAAEFPYDLIYNKGLQRNIEYSYIEKLPNGNILLAGREPSSSYSSNPIFTTINTNGEVVSTKSVNTNLPSGASPRFGTTSIFKYKDKYIICGQLSGYIYGKVMLVDSNFNPLWAFTRSSGDYTYKFAHGYNDVIYTIYRIDDDTSIDDYFIESFDMNGNRLTSHRIVPSTNPDISIQNVIWLEDGTFIVTGSMKKNGDVSLITMKYSIQGNRIWEHEIPLNYYTNSVTLSACGSDMIHLKNGNIAILVHSRTAYTAPYSQRIYIYSQSGQLLKTLSTTDQYKLHKLTELEDNTLLLLGTRDNTKELYIENISLDGTINYSSANVTTNYGSSSNILADGSDIYIVSYTGISSMDIAYNLFTKLSLKPPTITLTTTTPKIGDNTPVSLGLTFKAYGNSINSIRIVDTLNNQYYNAALTGNLSFNVNEGTTIINAQVIGTNGSVLATSNLITIDKRNLLNQALGISSLKNDLQKVIVLDDSDRYYENNTTNQQLISQIKNKLSGFFIISNDVSPVLSPLLGY